MRRVLPLLLVLPSMALAARDWRAQQPPPGAEGTLPAPHVERADLPNGLAVLVLERHDIPYAVVRALLPAGAAAQPAGKAGLASFTAEMLRAGTQRYGALELADEVAQIGAQLSSDGGTESATAQISTLKKTLPRALELLAEVVVRPTFPAKEIERVRARRISQIIERADDPAEALWDLVPVVAFGAGHPYAAPELGTKETVTALTRSDVLAFYRDRYRAGGSALLFVGDVTLAEARALAEKSAFGSWATGRVATVAVDQPKQPARRGIVLVDKPGAVQSQVALALVTVPRTSPDYVPLLIANACFGGIFSSRLNLNLREVHGYTYGARSAIHWHRGPSLFMASAGIRTDVTTPSIGEFRNELRKIIAEPPTEAEIGLAKAQLLQGVVRKLETMRAASAALSEIFLYNLPLDYYQRFVAEMTRTTAADVKRAIAAHLRPDQAALVVIGDRARIEPDFTIERRDIFGRPIR